MSYLLAIFGLIVVFGLAFLASSDRKKIKMKPIIIMVVIQIVLAFLLLNTKIGYVVIKAFAGVFGKLLEYAAVGVNFVFGGIANGGEAPFFLTVLLPIVFISV